MPQSWTRRNVRRRQAKQRRRNRRVQRARRLDNNKPCALLIGIEYTRYSRRRVMDRLPGCHNDIKNMTRTLQEKFNVPLANMKLLVDDFKGQWPTTENIRQGLRWLKNTGSKDLWIVYSGHGSHVRDDGNDEPDGQDEVLVPDNYMTSGYVRDDALFRFAKSLSSDVKLNCIFDCCHSGSMLDMPYYYHAEKVNQEDVATKRPWNVEVRADVTCLSACTDKQTSVSAYNMNKKRQWQGALTNAFCKSVSRGHLDGKQMLLRVTEFMQKNHFDQHTILSHSKSTDDASEISFWRPQ